MKNHEKTKILLIEDEAEELRIRYKYRRLIVEGKISIPYADAARLIGPDSAYRLYGTQKSSIRKKRRVPKNDNGKQSSP